MSVIAGELLRFGSYSCIATGVLAESSLPYGICNPRALAELSEMRFCLLSKKGTRSDKIRRLNE